MPELGTFNLHASLLPQYRGAAPINWAIMNGETETGATTFFIRHEIDTGTIILQEKEPIYPNDTVGTLYERLMKLGARLVVRTVQQIRDGNYSLTEQKDNGNLKSAPKLFRENCEVDWNWPAEKIYNFVRGLSPYPSAWTVLNGNTYKLFEVAVVEKADGIPGSISVENSEITITAGKGAVKIIDLQADGKKRMKASEFLRGNTI
jgi:methionyl-tRNA formyltransferase